MKKKKEDDIQIEKKRFGDLTVLVRKAKNLVNKDTGLMRNDASDPYVLLEVTQPSDL